MNDKEISSLLERFLVPSRLERLESVLHSRTGSLTVVLDDIANAHNVSAVLRSADAFGLSEVHLVGNSFEYSSGISLGTERWMQLQQHSDPSSACTALRAADYDVVVLQPEEDKRFDSVETIPITALPFETPLALVFGNEHRGVSQEFVDKARYRAFIPMYGFVESLNISVACAITLFCSTIAASQPQRRCSPLKADAREALRAQWLQQSVRGSEVILREVAQREEKE